MKYYVYGLIDPRNNKIQYIGKGQGNRMFYHIKYAKYDKPFDNNFIKFSVLNEILKNYEDIAYCKLFETDNEEEAYTKEKELIILHNTLSPKGWNIASGGIGGMNGRRHSKVTKQKMSKSAIGRHHSTKTKEKLSEAHKGKVLSKETREKMSKSRKGWKFSEESKRKMAESAKGKVMSKEARRKISEHRKGCTSWNKGISPSEETRRKWSKIRIKKGIIK